MNSSLPSGISAFIFAHQDDELCAALLIASRKAEGRAVRVVYLTDGEAGRASAETRNRESRDALGALGVSADEVVFLGTEHRFPDGKLYTVLPQALNAVEETMRPIEPVHEIFTLAYEGGHQDHDATHAVAVILAKQLGLLERTRQVPFYRAGGGLGLRVAVLAPLVENGPVTHWPLGVAERIRMLALMGRYPSQWRVLLVLGPLLAAACALRPGLPLQPVSLDRLRGRPTAEPLFYERRREVDPADVSAAISKLLRDL
jgi:LmbE family N-acetylglucosaminyl deacetylase